MHTRAGLLAVVCLLGGCEHRLSAELLEVRELSPDRIEAGHLLEARGSGFPVGRGGRLELDGDLVRPGGTREHLHYTFDALAVSDVTVEARVTAADLRAIGRGTFRGSVRIAFVAEGARGDVSGSRSDAVIDFLPPSPHAGATAPGMLGRALGIEISDGEIDGGLIIERVEPGSRAESAGIAAGDRIVEVDGLRPLWPEELAQTAGATRVELVIARGQARVPVSIDVEQATGHVQAAHDAALYELAALIAIAALLGSSRLGPALAKIRSPALGRASSWLVGVGTIAALALAIEAGHRALVDALAVPVLLARVALAVSRNEATLPARVVRGLGALLGAVAIAAAVAALAGLAGTVDLLEIERAQRGGPLHWGAFSTPVGASVIALLVPAVGLGGDGSHRLRGWSRWLDDAALAALAMALGSYLAGGLGEDTTDTLLALLARFALFVLLAASRDAEFAPSARVLATGVLLAVTAGTTAFVALHPDVIPARACAEIAATGAAAAILRIVMASASPTARPTHQLL